ncbi:MAG: thiol peroxidase [Chloroflexi bacterium]|nr:thiol peroxidase [Chloroflexota bacterium]MXX82932.1 thiol peroxidase [Chloroflexota bacterium]MYA94108.1 thiol peroxidase [Chloroflexota bacterium]MYC55584.1 thiol peroxidase [Chloroflexota bacterium]MYD38096.1 thiol peroxidase [Chloroflexota bacterium]
MMVGDNEHPIQNDMLAVGSAAPDFTLIANDLSSRSLADYAGQVKVISVIPSIDTGVCATQTRRFNAEAAGLNETVVLTVSADMPFALGRFCGAEGIDNTETLTTQRDMQFADDYGVHDTEWRICQRAVFVLDRDNVLRHVEYVGVIGDEVDYDSALAAARALA